MAGEAWLGWQEHAERAVHTVANQEAEEVEPNQEPGTRDHV